MQPSAAPAHDGQFILASLATARAMGFLEKHAIPTETAGLLAARCVTMTLQPQRAVPRYPEEWHTDCEVPGVAATLTHYHDICQLDVAFPNAELSLNITAIIAEADALMAELGPRLANDTGAFEQAICFQRAAAKVSGGSGNA
jgi:hypothetical protein